MYIADLQPDAVTRRVAPVRMMAEQEDLEPEHPMHVCALSRVLFVETQSLHGLRDGARALLEAAALLHDVGLREGAKGHHKRSYAWIMAHELPGFDEREQRVIANIARYHRKAHPGTHHGPFRALSPEDQETVRVLAGILRVADGLDRAHAQASRGIRAQIDGTVLLLHVAQEVESSTDIWGAMRKRLLLEEVLGVTMDFAVERISTTQSPP